MGPRLAKSLLLATAAGCVIVVAACGAAALVRWLEFSPIFQIGAAVVVLSAAWGGFTGYCEGLFG